VHVDSDRPRHDLRNARINQHRTAAGNRTGQEFPPRKTSQIISQHTAHRNSLATAANKI
jgi:hypothetical protein